MTGRSEQEDNRLERERDERNYVKELTVWWEKETDHPMKVSNEVLCLLENLLAIHRLFHYGA